MTEPRDDEELVRRLRRGDARAQRQLFDGHRPTVHRHLLAKKWARCDEDAEEIVQDTFVRAFRDIASFQRRSTLRTWLITLSRNASVDFYRLPRNRYDARSPELPAAREPEAAYDCDPPPLTPLETVLAVEDKRRARDQLLRAFAKLDEDQRDVLIHRKIDELSTAETADVMRRTESAVKMLLLRAMEKLSAILEEDTGQPEVAPKQRGEVRA